MDEFMQNAFRMSIDALPTPSHDDPNSREAAEKSDRSPRAKARRWLMLQAIREQPGRLHCDYWCRGEYSVLGHGAISGGLSVLWSHGIIERVGRVRNVIGNYEWSLSLTPRFAEVWDEVDASETPGKWQERFGLIKVPEPNIEPAPRPERWQCMGTSGKSGTKPHVLPPTEQPDQPTTDMSERYKTGLCPGCRTRTIWRRLDVGSPDL